MPIIQWKSLRWEDLEFHLSGRLVLRHNKHLQYGYTPKPNETLAHALMAMQVGCMIPNSRDLISQAVYRTTARPIPREIRKSQAQSRSSSTPRSTTRRWRAS